MINFFTKRIKRMKNKKGFTLVELIVVIVIIGILAAIVIPRLAGFTDTAEKKKVTADARTILTALSTIYADTTSSGAVTGLTETDAELTALTGDLGDGNLEGVTCTDSGEIDFTYTIGDWTATVSSGAITSVE